MDTILASKQIGIIGAGKVGLSLALLCQNKGYSVVVGSRRYKQTHLSLAERNLQLQIDSDINRIARKSSIIILAVADAQIQALCEKLTPELRSGTVVTHLSGALSSTILASAQASGAVTASTHPLNTFPNLDAAIAVLQNKTHNTALFCEGEHTAMSILIPFFEDLGFKCQQVNPTSKVLYHAACVTACNYLTTLVDASAQMANGAGLDAHTFTQALAPILNATLDNIEEHGTLQSLSGPISRGDAATVSAHMRALHNAQLNPRYAALYTALGQHALSMTERSGTLSGTQIEALRKALEST